MNEKNTLALIAAAPLLYRHCGDKAYAYPIKYGIECGDGWFDLLMRLSVKIEADLRTMLAEGKRPEDLPSVLQVKEKFGTLRFHMSQFAQWREWITEAAKASGQTCERCGLPGSSHIRSGFIKTLCPAHAAQEGFGPVELPEPEEVVINGVSCRLAPVARSRHALDTQARAAFLSARPLLLLNPRSPASVEIAAPEAGLPIIERMADRMEAELDRLVKAGLPSQELPIMTRIAVIKGSSLAVDILPGTLPEAAKAEFDGAITEAVVALGHKPSIALAEHRQAIPAIVASCNCTNPRVFGSVLRGTDTFASDLDLLVDPLENTTLFHLGRLQHELSNLLKVRVQVVTPGDLPEKWRQTVLDEARPV